MATDLMFEKQVAECTKLYDKIEAFIHCGRKTLPADLVNVLREANDLEVFGGWEAVLLLGVNVNDIKSVIFINEKPSELYLNMFKIENIPIYYFKTMSDKLELL
jgi:hypothetical protein